MLRIKRLYLFILQTFLPLFMMTFFICLFIVLMQFLWRYVDELVGKGLEMSVIAELFFYAAMTMIPLALPLAILLASLMVFGNLGEKFELTAMKAAGVSLIRIMAPLIIVISGISIGAFFFQNDVLPKAQVKMWTLLFSMRQKSPELDIPEGAFYDQIQGYNIYIKNKNRETGMLHDMMIYDVSKGYGSANIIVTDSGKLSFTADKKHLFLKLFEGESFEDLRDAGPMSKGNIMYRRESFFSKEIMIPFDANFNRLDDETMRNQYIGKNISELQHTIDSVNVRIDSVGGVYSAQLKENPYFGIPVKNRRYEAGKLIETPNKPIILDKPMDVDSAFHKTNLATQRSIVSSALSKAIRLKQEYEFKGYAMADDMNTIRRHEIELQKKFTLAIACLIFFFIGAPLGSIIRKGGLAIPIVVSVLLFVVYYIIDNSGLKLAKEGLWEVWQGIWLSTAVLLPLGIFLTYKAVNDSAVFNPDAYQNFFKRILGQQVLRHIEMKEIVMDDVVNADGIARLENVKTLCASFLSKYAKRQRYIQYWQEGYSRQDINQLSEELEETVKYLSNSQDILVINKTMDYPIIRKLFFYHPTNIRWVGLTIAIVFPLGLIGYYIGIKQQNFLKREIKTIEKVSSELIVLLEKDNNKTI